uniref:NADH dehydrogenase subunit 6 n=1 Tax=Epeorus unispinosus TaxID=2969354 RepID=UPI002176ECE3|nr:NADH dehydrogenase subunit 6 [Epeorus unispinosus]UUJ36781.1 NADH dehydrogenase subunit 6 [Epeorus unispinosus]
MTHSLLLTLCLATGFNFLHMSHPLAMGLTLLCQTLLIALVTGLCAPTFWFSYILFLVFLGGMLVLFIYVTSLASNEMFSVSSHFMLLTLIFVATIGGLNLLNDPTTWLPSNPSDQALVSDWNSPPLTLHLLVKLYNTPTYALTLLLVLYLFLTLIAVVTVTQIFAGPLRPKN